MFILDYDTFKSDYINIAKRSITKCDMIWFRIKNVDASMIYQLASDLKKNIAKPLMLSERADIATALCYDGVHLSSNSMPCDVVKKAYPHLQIGYSAHSVEECKQSTADYITLSPLLPTEKVGYTPTPLGLIEAPCKNVYALGGMTFDVVEDVAKLNYAGIAGIKMFID